MLHDGRYHRHSDGAAIERLAPMSIASRTVQSVQGATASLALTATPGIVESATYRIRRRREGSNPTLSAVSPTPEKSSGIPGVFAPECLAERNGATQHENSTASRSSRSEGE